MKVYYFGAWASAGHRIWTPDGDVARRAGPWTDRDLDHSSYKVRYYGGPAIATGHGFVPVDGEETMGVWRLTSGCDASGQWTALGCYDRTQDRWKGSISVFVAEGEHDEAAMQALAAQHFPAVWARIHGRCS